MNCCKNYGQHPDITFLKLRRSESKLNNLILKKNKHDLVKAPNTSRRHNSFLVY
jgi:hypothetical protein